MRKPTADNTAWRGWLPVPRLELALALLTLVFSAALGLGGLAFVGPSLLVPLGLLLLVAFVHNLLLIWLDRRQDVPERVITWGARLGNVALLSAAVYLTGGFDSPFFFLYVIYLVVASLQYGWRGTGRSFALCFVCWAALVILDPPAETQEWANVAMLVGAFLIIALVVGFLAQQHVRYRQESEKRSEEMTFLREAGRSLSASLDPQEVLADTLARVNELLDVEAASLALVDPATGRITFELAVGGSDEMVQGLRLEPGQGIVGQVVQQGRALLVPDVAADPHWHAAVDEASGYHTRSILCLPLKSKGQVIGALEVLNKRDGPFTEEDRRVLSSLAALAAQSLENARLHDQIRQHVERLQAAYDEVQKLDELKSAFIRNVSHELRTPLALIEGYLDLLLDGQLGPLHPEQQRSLALMAEKSAQLSRMVNDLISLQTIGALGFDLEALSLEDLAHAAVDDLLSKAQKASICLELQCPKDLPPIHGDARRLAQVFYHLLDNAIKFSPNGGTVSVSLQREGEMLRVCVKDQGIGLPTDQLERVFDRFYQVDGSATRRYGGTGLGLALVKEVVEAHGGAIWVESDGRPGRGCTFNVFLPVLDKQVTSRLRS